MYIFIIVLNNEQNITGVSSNQQLNKLVCNDVPSPNTFSTDFLLILQGAVFPEELGEVQGTSPSVMQKTEEVLAPANLYENHMNTSSVVSIGMDALDRTLQLIPKKVAFDTQSLSDECKNLDVIALKQDKEEVCAQHEEKNLDFPEPPTIFIIQDVNFKGSANSDEQISAEKEKRKLLTDSDVIYNSVSTHLKSLKVDLGQFKMDCKLNTGDNKHTPIAGKLSLDSNGLQEDNLHQLNHKLDEDEAVQTCVCFARVDFSKATTRYIETSKVIAENQYHAVAEQVKVTVVNAIKDNQGKLSVQLEPKELGKMEIVLDVQKDSVTVNIFADKLSTYEMLQKNAEQLNQQVRDTTGMDLSTNLNFAYRRFNREGNEAEEQLKNMTDDASVSSKNNYANGLPIRSILVRFDSSSLDMFI